jgi:hypothetical protein
MSEAVCGQTLALIGAAVCSGWLAAGWNSFGEAMPIWLHAPKARLQLVIRASREIRVMEQLSFEW